MSDKKILQPYIRRRAFNKIHVHSWLIYLEKDGFVRCSFQNCNFMAFDVEEMCNHYGFCKGESSTAKHVCKHCGGRTVSLKKLQHHLALAHNVSSTEVEEDTVETEDTNPEPTESGKQSRVMELMWQYFHEKHNYIKCSSCNYIANTVTDMSRHYPLCKQEMNLLMYVCPECKGRTMNVNPLLWHMERSHKIFRAPSQFNHITKTMIRFWKREIAENNYASCLHIVKGQRDCFYFDLDLLGIIEHSQSCKGPNVGIRKEQCPHCPMWTGSVSNLAHHVEVQHGEKNRGMIVTNSRETIAESSNMVNENGNRPSALSVCKDIKPFTITSDLIGSELYLEPQEEIVITESGGCTNQPLEFVGVKPEVKVEEIEGGEKEKTGYTKVPLADPKGFIEVKQETQNNSMTLSHDQLDYVPISVPGLVKHGSQPEKQTNKDLRDRMVQNLLKSHIQEEEDEKILTIDLEEETQEKEESRTEYRSLTRLNIKSYKKGPFDKLSAIKKDNLIDELKNNKYESLPSTSNKCVASNDNRLRKDGQKPNIISNDQNISVNKNRIPQDGLLIPYMGGDYIGENIVKKQLLNEKEKVVIIKLKETIEDGNKIEKMERRKPRKEPLKPSCYNLFKDEISSDEDDNLLQEKKQKEKEVDEICKTYSSNEKEQACEKRLPKNYLKRSGNSKSVGMSQNKRLSTSSEQNNSLETERNSEDSDAADQTETCLEKDKQFSTINEHLLHTEDKFRKHKQPASESFIENAINKNNKLPQHISKSSEKNDKLMPDLAAPDLSEELSEKSCDEKVLESKKPFSYNSGSIEVVGIQFNIQKKDDTGLIKSNQDSPILHVGRHRLHDNHPKSVSLNATVITSSPDKSQQKNTEDLADKNKECSVIAKTQSTQKHTPDFVEGSSYKDVFLAGRSQSEVKDTGNSTSPEELENRASPDSLKIPGKDYGQHKNRQVQVLNVKTINNHKIASESAKYVVEKTNVSKDSVEKIKNTESLNEENSKTKSVLTLGNNTRQIQSDPHSSETCNALNNQCVKNIDVEEIHNDVTKTNCDVQLNLNLLEINSKHNINVSLENNENLNVHVNLEKNDCEFVESESLDTKENSNFAQDSRIVSFFYQGRLNRHLCDQMSPPKDLEKNNKRTLNDRKNEEMKNSVHLPNVSCSLKNTDITETNDNMHLPISSGGKNDVTCEFIENKSSILNRSQSDCSLNNEDETPSDINRRISSDWCEESSPDEEDFLGTDEELDMKDHLFNGFKELSERSRSLNRRFHQFLNRLSESENEEWYVNAGNLSMDIRKQEYFLSDKHTSKAQCRSSHEVKYNKFDNKLKFINKSEFNDSFKDLENKHKNVFKEILLKNGESNKDLRTNDIDVACNQFTSVGLSKPQQLTGPADNAINNMGNKSGSSYEEEISSKFSANISCEKSELNITTEDNDSPFIGNECQSKNLTSNLTDNVSSEKSCKNTLKSLVATSSAKRKRGKPPQKINVEGERGKLPETIKQGVVPNAFENKGNGNNEKLLDAHSVVSAGTISNNNPLVNEKSKVCKPLNEIRDTPIDNHKAFPGEILSSQAKDDPIHKNCIRIQEVSKHEGNESKDSFEIQVSEMGITLKTNQLSNPKFVKCDASNNTLSPSLSGSIKYSSDNEEFKKQSTKNVKETENALFSRNDNCNLEIDIIQSKFMPTIQDKDSTQSHQHDDSTVTSDDEVLSTIKKQCNLLKDKINTLLEEKQIYDEMSLSKINNQTNKSEGPIDVDNDLIFLTETEYKQTLNINENNVAQINETEPPTLITSTTNESGRNIKVKFHKDTNQIVDKPESVKKNEFCYKNKSLALQENSTKTKENTISSECTTSIERFEESREPRIESKLDCSDSIKESSSTEANNLSKVISSNLIHNPTKADSILIYNNSTSDVKVSALPKKRGRPPKNKPTENKNTTSKQENMAITQTVDKSLTDGLSVTVSNDELDSSLIKEKGELPKPDELNNSIASSHDDQDNSLTTEIISDGGSNLTSQKNTKKRKSGLSSQNISDNNEVENAGIANTEHKPSLDNISNSHQLNQTIIFVENRDKNSSTNVISPFENNTPLKKRRGRPPKAKNSNLVIELTGIDTNNDVNVDHNSLKEKTKRGNKLSQKEKQNKIIDSTHDNLGSPLTTPQSTSNAFPKKKRGRPPKLLNSSLTSEYINTEAFEDDKQQQEVKNSSFKNIKHEISKLDLNQSISSYNGDLENSLESDLAYHSRIHCLLPKKKRGRPPKSNNSSFTLGHAVTVKSELNKIVLHQESNTPSLKKRGRQAKIKLDPDVCSDLDSKQMDSTSLFDRIEISEKQIRNQPKKRGRKPKIKTEDSDNQSLIDKEKLSCSTVSEGNLESDSDSFIPKKRGRPSKQSIQLISQNESNVRSNTDIMPIPKKRGRKPKVLHNDSSINDSQSPDDSTKFEDSSNKNQLGTELLGTDIILINEEKLKNGMFLTPKKRGRPPKPKLSLEQHEDTNSETDLSKVPLVSKRKKKKIVFDQYLDEDDHGDDLSDSSDEEPVNKAKPGRKPSKAPIQRYKPAEETFFSSKHSNSDEVTCGVCKEVMTYRHYKSNHAVLKHYMLCWIEGEEKPVDMDDAKDVVNRLWYAKKRLGKTPFKCFTCNLPKLSAVGFQSHIRFCGKEHEEKESLLATCEFCGVRLMPSSMRPHKYIKHSSSMMNTFVDKNVIIPKAKRAAANRAVEVIHSQKEENEPEEPQSRPASPETKDFLSHLYVKPSKTIPNEEYRRWKTSLQATNIVKCIYPECGFSADSTVAFRKHYFSCTIAPPRLYKCRQCDFNCEMEQAMHDHLVECHEDLMHPRESSEGEMSGASDGESKIAKPQSMSFSYNASLPFKFLKGVCFTRVRGSQKKYFFTDALSWTLKLRRKILTDEVMFGKAGVSAGNGQPLPPEVLPQYLPQVPSSVKFRGSDGTWQTLRRFQGTLVDGVPVMFAGGPVWATAWAPVPDTEAQQYLALATHPNMDTTHEMSSFYNYKSLIQIWAFGYLSNMDPSSGTTPKFLMGIAHSRGAVWSLQWCPSGCYQESRLGLLAASCSDGSIVIYSVPRYRYSFEFTIYDVKPVIELKLGCEMLSQCTCIDWHTVAPHSLMVGGFANGMVAMWDLTTKSPLLKEGTTLLPFRVIEAHLSSVSAVKLSPTLENVHLMTTSLDRATKFWRLDDMTAPINMLRKASVVDAVMPSHWLTSINAYDDVFSINSSHITGYNYRETFSQNNTNYMLQSGTVWSVSFNDWLNSCACASEMGKVSLFFRQQLLVSEDSKKVKKDSLIADLITCSVQPLNSWSSHEEFGQSYSECVSNIGLEINFQENITESNKSKLGSSSDTMDTYPILSINKVAWNPNLHSFSWLAAGLQCGLVMAPRVKCLPNKEIAELYKVKDER